MGRLTACVAAVGLLVAVGAASASAASFVSGSSSVKLAGTLTWKLGGGSPVTCPVTAPGTISPGLWSGYETAATCSNGAQIANGHFAYPLSDGAGAYSVRLAGGLGGRFSPWGGWWRSPAVVPFINGNASTPSRIVLNDTYVGELAGTSTPITLSGTLNMTTSTGGLVTVN